MEATPKTPTQPARVSMPIAPRVANKDPHLVSVHARPTPPSQSGGRVSSQSGICSTRPSFHYRPVVTITRNPDVTISMATPLAAQGQRHT
jgi:hypothetical protein